MNRTRFLTALCASIFSISSCPLAQANPPVATSGADLQAYAQALTEVGKMPPEKVKEELILELEKVLAPRVRTFSREVVFYHWAPRGPTVSQSAEFHHPDVEKYIKGVVARADMSPADWDVAKASGLPTSNGAAGNGLYLATDPLSTTQYGGSDPMVVQVALKPGTKYLDADDMTFAPSPRLNILFQVFRKEPQIQLQLRTIGLISEIQGIKEMETEILPVLRKKLGFSAMVYFYGASTLPICGKPKGQPRRQVAFVLQDSKSIEWKDTGVLAGKPKLDDPASVQCSVRIDAITTTGISFANVQNILIPASKLGGSVFPSMAPWGTDLGALKKAIQKATPAKNSTEQTWAKTHLFDCGDFAEDKPPTP